MQLNNTAVAIRIKKKATPQAPQPCIRCDKCAAVCPAHLLPQELFWHIQGHDLPKSDALGLFNCIECRLCEKICPSDIPLVTFFQSAKNELNHIQQEKLAAEKAKKHFLEKQQRSHEKLVRAQKKQEDIKASLNRVKEKITS